VLLLLLLHAAAAAAVRFKSLLAFPAQNSEFEHKCVQRCGIAVVVACRSSHISSE
jgi:hypothetical protein